MIISLGNKGLFNLPKQLILSASCVYQIIFILYLFCIHCFKPYNYCAYVSAVPPSVQRHTLCHHTGNMYTYVHCTFDRSKRYVEQYLSAKVCSPHLFTSMLVYLQRVESPGSDLSSHTHTTDKILSEEFIGLNLSDLGAYGGKEDLSMCMNILLKD